MKKFILLFFVLTSRISFSQFQELTIGIGYSYYFGDLNIKNTDKGLALIGDLLDPKNFKMSYSAGYRYNLPNYLSLGLNFYHMYLSGDDSDNEISGPTDIAFYRKLRNLNFHTAVNEAFIDIRFEPMRTERKWTNEKTLISPYIGAGIGLFSFNPKSFTNGGHEVELQPLGTEGQGIAGYEKKYDLIQPFIPVNIGIRFIPKSRRFAISMDFNYNFTFTDYIDDVSTVYANPNDLRIAYQVSKPSLYALVKEMNDRRPIAYQHPDRRGNKLYNDFFMTGQIKFSYFLFNKSAKSYYKCCDF